MGSGYGALPQIGWEAKAMTRADFIARFPHASEMTIYLNFRDVTTLPVSAPMSKTMSKTMSKPAPITHGQDISEKAHRKPSKRVLLPRTRNAGTMTEGAYWGALRSLLRQFSLRRWKPRNLALAAAKIPFNGPNNQRFAYRCCACAGAFKRDAVEVDHVESCGSLTSHADLGPFVARLLAEDPRAWRVMCKPCHLSRTNAAALASRSNTQTDSPQSALRL